MTEILFIVEEDDGGFHAKAVGASIFTQAGTREELVKNVRDAVLCHYDPPNSAPKIAHLHFVRDETIAIPGATAGTADTAHGTANRAESSRYPLHDKQPYRFDDPFAPVGLEDWDLLK